MITRIFQYILTAAAVLTFCPACLQAKETDSWQKEFAISKCNLITTGRNEYFVLEPGYPLVFEGGDTKLQITVLNETKTLDGAVTRVVEEREWKGGKLHEV